jgi:hypothetical protein
MGYLLFLKFSDWRCAGGLRSYKQNMALSITQLEYEMARWPQMQARRTAFGKKRHNFVSFVNFCSKFSFSLFSLNRHELHAPAYPGTFDCDSIEAVSEGNISRGRKSRHRHG